jgi:hypothetical protein
MRVNTSIGEIGVSANGRDFLFRPSLFAMQKLEDPIRSFVDIHNPERSKNAENQRFIAAVEVLEACIDDDISDLVGYMSPRYHGDSFAGFSWRCGLINFTDCIILAASLIRHGVVGVVPVETKKPEGGYSSKFEPRELASIAMAHLGMNEADAWNLTVTGFIMAMRAKFPDPKKEEEKKADEALKKYDIMMEKNKRIAAARAQARAK